MVLDYQNHIIIGDHFTGDVCRFGMCVGWRCQYRPKHKNATCVYHDAQKGIFLECQCLMGRNQGKSFIEVQVRLKDMQTTRQSSVL